MEKIKPALKMSVQRIQLLKNKKTISQKKQKKVVAQMLADGLEEKARITTESIVRQDFIVEAYDILELLCQLVLERIRLLDAEKECPFDMREAVCTLIYAANRTEIPELKDVKEQLIKKYGKEFGEAAMRNHNGCVNERILHKLSAQPPNAFLVLNYMKELANEYAVDWQPDELLEQAGNRFDAPMFAPTGMSIAPGTSSGLGAGAYRVTDGSILPPGRLPADDDFDIPAAPTSSSRNKPSGGGSNSGGGSKGQGFKGGSDGDFDIPDAPGHSTSTAGLNSLNKSNGLKSSTITQTQDLDDLIPMAPTFDPRSQRKETQGDVVDDKNTYNADDAAVPDFDELTARFNALKKK